jgi:hypothetical protein
MSPKTEATATSSGTYFLCAWNAWVKSAGEQSEEWYDAPQGTVYSMKYFLEAAAPGWSPLKKTEDASSAGLIVVVPRERDPRLSVDDLRVYATGLGGLPKKVFYVHSSGSSTFMDGLVNDWLFVAMSAACATESFARWLDTENAAAARGPLPSFDLAYAKEKLNVPLAGRSGHVLGTLELSRSGQQLMSEAMSGLPSSPARLFFGLCRLSKDYHRVEHDINAGQAGQRIPDSNATARDDNRLPFLDVCVDLRTAIAARSRCEAPTSRDRSRILLIDDNPSRNGFETLAREAVKEFLPGFTLSVWNPDEKTGERSVLHRGDIERYASMHVGSVGDLLNRRLVTVGDKVEEESLREILEKTHVVLVDILFNDARGSDHEAGYGIVRGLQRIFRDVQNKMPKGWYIPEVLAISRATDIEKVHTVYRSGAAGYVRKDRPLSIPGAVARTLQPAIDGVAAAAHRNFRALYNLPHATLGELHAIRVPPIPFHQPPRLEGHANPQDLRGGMNLLKRCRDEQVEVAQPLAKLLAVLPKADLHVHPGTCMKPEFLVVASLIMLMHREAVRVSEVTEAVKTLSALFGGKTLRLDDFLAVTAAARGVRLRFSGRPEGISLLGTTLRKYLMDQVEAGDLNRQSPKQDFLMECRYKRLRSILHAEFNISDHVAAGEVSRAISGLSDGKCFFFALQHNRVADEKIRALNKDDLLRFYLLWLAGDPYAYGDSCVTMNFQRGTPATVNLNDWFRKGKIDPTIWGVFHNVFYAGDRRNNHPHWSKRDLEASNWRLESTVGMEPPITVSLGASTPLANFLADCPTARDHPIAWLVASGTRSSNLREYLEGSDYTGSEHLKHPFLMHLFAQQAVYEFIRHGVLYAELRTALSGYANPHLDISFSDACTCFRTAMGQAQLIAQYAYFKVPAPGAAHGSPVWLWKNCYAIEDLFNPVNDELASYRFPCKTSIVLTGKRDKPSRVLLREAGAGAVLHARPVSPAESAIEFVERSVPECRVVGFDLAGQEDDHPPQLFREEYNQIARMHIPVTAHAGENAPSDFVESAILDLRARRIGHGLALADDKALMERARDDGTCVELCPVSNFQTNAVYPYKMAGTGREYPLRKFLEVGLNVTINTDNPVVSYTNMVKECFQAAYALGSARLSLWDLLRILRAGFTQSFLTQPERHAVLELADQLVFDLFSRPEIVSMLTMVLSDSHVQRMP